MTKDVKDTRDVYFPGIFQKFRHPHFFPDCLHIEKQWEPTYKGLELKITIYTRLSDKKKIQISLELFDLNLCSSVSTSNYSDRM